MYSIIISLLLLVTPFAVLSQTKLPMDSRCVYTLDTLADIDLYTFEPDKFSIACIERITSASGLPQNFKIVSGNVSNACATIIYNQSTKSNERYIIYNQTFVNRLRALKNDWIVLSILAHEIGHHLSGHSLSKDGSRPGIELEADKFSGFILQRLGATLEDTQAAISLLGSSVATKTHPEKTARLAAIASGWTNAFDKFNTTSIEDKVVDGFKIGSVVTYQVESNDCIATVQYHNETESIEVKNIYISNPRSKTWTKQFVITKPKQKLKITGFPGGCRKGQLGSITVRILIDGKLLKSATGDGIAIASENFDK